MIKSSSKYNMSYFNIKQLENKLDIKNLSTTLWSVRKSKLISAFADIFPNTIGKTFNFFKDIHPEKNKNGDTIYRGLFIVICEKMLTESEMQILLTQYLTEHPEIDLSIPQNNQNIENHNSNKEIKLSSDNMEDLNLLAENLERDNLVFGVLDDINHLDALSKIDGIDIISDFGDFKKVYFSIPSFRQDEALAHSVTILKQIKCKRSLLDYIIQ